MARYIDADALYKKLYPFNSVDKRLYTINAKAVADAIAKTPTADVVPKSEVEELKHKYDLAVAEREANVKGFAEDLAKAKSAFAREIFWEIDKLLTMIYTDDEDGSKFIGVDMQKYYALEKKYCIESEVTK